MNKEIKLVNFLDDEGVKKFIFLQASIQNFAEINKKIRLKQRVNFKDYGEVLFIGTGQPDETIIEYMQSEYGYQG